MSLPTKCLTELCLKNGERYPLVYVAWTRDEDGLGVSGVLEVHEDEKTKSNKTHTIDLRQSTPLDKLLVSFDDFMYGCWAMADLPIEGLTIRDLHWATAWAAQAMNSKNHAFGEVTP